MDMASCPQRHGLAWTLACTRRVTARQRRGFDPTGKASVKNHVLIITLCMKVIHKQSIIVFSFTNPVGWVGRIKKCSWPKGYSPKTSHRTTERENLDDDDILTKHYFPRAQTKETKELETCFDHSRSHNSLVIGGERGHQTNWPGNSCKEGLQTK
jgi:hypothetical protein